MLEKNNLEKITNITLYTGTYGKSGCTSNCIGCTQANITDEKYQGKIEQIEEILVKCPNLKKTYILGNPDISVDSEFCNIAARKFIEKNINVMFSTSGYNIIETLEKILEKIDSKYVEYISFSIDSVNEKMNQYLKGNNRIFLKEIGQGIEYCKEKNINVKIQPTLWQINQNQYNEIIKYFYEKYNVKWFTFHAGSFESLKNKNIPLKHILPDKWRKITKDIEKMVNEKQIKISIPRLFLNKEEKEIYDKSIHTYCSNCGTKLQLWLKNGKIEGAYCPLLSEIDNTYKFNLGQNEVKLVNENINCSICSKCIDNDLLEKSINKSGSIFNNKKDTLFNVCRFYYLKY